MATSPLVPSRLPVAIEDHAYQIDPSKFRRQTVPVLRQQADTSTEPGEMSLNPQGLWRRSQESWHHGAGQNFLDGRSEVAPDPHRFRASKGVDVWTRGQVSLLRPTLKIWSTSATNLYLATATSPGSPFLGLYAADGTEVWLSFVPFQLLNTIALQQGTGWTPTNATLAPGGTSNDFMHATATASAAVSLTSPTGTGGFPVDGGRQYLYVFETYNISGSGAKTAQAFLNWYDAAGVFISSSAVTTAPTSEAAGASTVSTSATAPATAAFMSITGTWTANLTNADVKRIAVAVTPADGAVTGGVADRWRDCDVNAGEAAQTVQSLASDGTYVWAALGTSGLHRILSQTATANVPAAPASGQISLVGYANGWLLAAGSSGVASTRENTLWFVRDPLTSPTLVEIKTHPNTSFKWVGISSGRNCVYAFGNSGINAEVYKITLDPNTGVLSSAASFATYLPDGETIHALQHYAGGIIMGTGKGVRLGQADGAGNIDYGPLIDTPYPVRCLEPQGRYCWFGWQAYDSQTSGLGRIDLGFFVDNLTPAYASDLMTVDTSTGAVVSCVTFTPFGFNQSVHPPVRIFTVAGEGVYSEDAGSRVLSGQLDTGTIRFATSEPKTARSLDVRHHALPAGGPIAAELQRDDAGTWTAVGSSSTTGSYGPAAPLDLQNLNAEALEFRFTLDRPDSNGTDFTRSPELTRWTAKVLPTPSTIDAVFTIPILLRREVSDNNDANYPVDVPTERDYIEGLERSRALVTLQMGAKQETVYVASTEFEGQNWGPGKAYIEGVLHTTFQTVRG